MTKLGKTVALVGMMGAGKSSLGRRLAARLSAPFRDADSEIETAAGCSISEIFERYGEAAFRDGERRVIARLLAMTWETGTFWNVNLPHLMPDAPDPEVVFCPLDLSPMPIAYRLDDTESSAHFQGDYHARARNPGRDIDICFRGRIAVSLIRLGEAW